MYSKNYADESFITNCLKQFKRIYPEFRSRVIGISQDKLYCIIECDFPDGTFYFRVDERTISSSYDTKEEADKG